MATKQKIKTSSLRENSSNGSSRARNWSQYLGLLSVVAAFVLLLIQQNQTQHQEHANKLNAASFNLVMNLNGVVIDLIATQALDRSGVELAAIHSIYDKLEIPIVGRKTIDDALPKYRHEFLARKASICRKLEIFLHVTVGEEIFEEPIPATTCDNSVLTWGATTDRQVAAMRIEERIRTRYEQENMSASTASKWASYITLLVGFLGVAASVFGVAAVRVKQDS